MKFLKIEVEPGGIDGRITEEQAEEVRARMRASIETHLPEKQREAARKQADELVAALLKGGVRELSAHTMMGVLNDAVEALQPIARGVRALAQTLDMPSHIFALGGTASELIVAQGLLESAKSSLQDLIDCKHCKPEEPEPPKEGLS